MLPTQRMFKLAAVLFLVLGLGACRRPAPKPPKPAKVPVTTEIVQPRSFQASIGLLGRVVPASRIELRPPAEGRIRYTSGNSQGLRTGQTVRAGEPLFRIESPALDLRLSEAELSARAAETELERAKRGAEAGILPLAELEARQIDASLAAKRLLNAQQEYERLSVPAPASGVLKVQRAIIAGTEVGPDTLLAELAGDGAMRVEAWVPAAELDRLDQGLAVECRLPGSTTAAGMGVLTEIAQEVDAGGVARAMVEIRQNSGMPRFGEGVELRVMLPAKPEALTVPKQAVTVSGHVTSVFVLEKVGSSLKATVQLVQLGGRDGDRVEVLDGLKAGARVAVEGAEYLADGLLAEDVEDSKKGKP